MSPRPHFSIEDVRRAAARVASDARLVRINTDKIDDYAATIARDYPVIDTLDDNHVAAVNYVMALDSINFGSGYFAIAGASGVDLEYETIARGLKYAFLQGEMDTPEKWKRASPALCHQVFNIPPDRHDVLDTLVGQFAHHLNVTGEMITGFYDGAVENLLEEAGGSAVKLAETVARWSTFHDVASYNGYDVPILKRAQIFAADIYLALGGRGLADFQDMHRLTIFADNMVPHVLRHDGILSYDAELAAQIDAGIPVAAGSDAETELRAVAIHAVDLMAASLNGARTAVNIDHILWNRGYTPDFITKPRHSTLSIFY